MKSLIVIVLLFPFGVFSQVQEADSTSLFNEMNFSGTYSICVMTREYQIGAFGNLKYNIPHGEWVYFHSDLSIKEKGRYKKGVRVGEWCSYDQYGNLQSQGNYKKGKLHGEWIFYDGVREYKNGYRIK
jgi:hypothetical protein